MVVDSTIVWGYIVFIEKQSLLYCILVSFVQECTRQGTIHTSLKAGNGRRDFHAPGQQVGQARERSEEKQAHSCCCAKKGSFPPVDAHVGCDVKDRKTLGKLSRKIARLRDMQIHRFPDLYLRTELYCTALHEGIWMLSNLSSATRI